MARHHFLFTLLALVVMTALLARAQDVAAQPEDSVALASTDASPAAEALGKEAVDAVAAACALAQNCSQCKRSECGWCGESDSKGTCIPCTEKDCKKPDSCKAKYYTHNLCPSEIDDVLLSVGAIIGIVVGGAIGLCCLLTAFCGIIYCLCCRHHHGYHRF